MTWQEIRDIRKNGNFTEARRLALQELATTPNSLQLKSQLEWTYYDELKSLAQQIENNTQNQQVTNRFIQVFEEYIVGNPRRPEMAFSFIIKVIAGHAQQLPSFYSYIEWMGQQALRPDDWYSTEYNGRKIPPIAHDIARGLCKWIKSHDNVTLEQIKFCLTWVSRVRQNMTDEEAIWLDWDTVYLLRKTEDYTTASQILSSVIKQKQNEFWVWTEAARLHEEEQKDLALACFCKALLCPVADSSFLVKTHEEFAQFLACLEMYEKASYQINQALTIRQNKGWNINNELQSLLNQPWYNKSNNNHQSTLNFYKEHSQEALSLCFDKIEQISANYLGQIQIPRENKKPKISHKFAIMKNGKSESILVSGLRNIKFIAGEPVLLTMGINEANDKWTTVNAEKRHSGKNWDCTLLQQVMLSSIKDQEIRVFINRDDEIKLFKEVSDRLTNSINIGNMYNAYITKNAKNNRLEICHLEPSNETKLADTKKITGILKKNERGFGFLEDIFIPPYLLDSQQNGDCLTVIAVYSFNKAKEKYSWRAITIQ